MISPVYSYGLPVGSALILIAVSNTVFLFIDTIIEFTENAVWGRTETGVSLAAHLFVWSLAIICLGYGTVLRGSRKLLKIWMIFEIIVVVLCGIVVVLCILILLLSDLKEGGVFVNLHAIYLSLSVALFSIYDINLVYRSLPLLSSSLTFTEELEPIGKGFRYVIEHFKYNLKSAASLALMMEIIINLQEFVFRHVNEYIFSVEYDDEIASSAALTLENILVRGLRIGLCSIGFYLTYQGRQEWMYKWCFAYSVSITLSLAIFVYLIFTWTAVHLVLTVVYCCTFTFELLYRTGVLFVCLRYSGKFDEGTPSAPLQHLV